MQQPTESARGPQDEPKVEPALPPFHRRAGVALFFAILPWLLAAMLKVFDPFAAGSSDVVGSVIIVLMLGGRVRWEALSVVGQLGDGLFSRINVQKAFLGAAGFTIESGLADATDEEAQIKRAMVAPAREVIAIVDRTKWERAAFATFCRTDQISIVLTDEGAPEPMVKALIGRGVDVRLVGPDQAVGSGATDSSGTTRSNR